MLESDFLEMASTTVTLEQLSTHSVYGAPQYSTTPQTFQAYVEPDARLVRDASGQEVMTKFFVVVLSSSASIGTHDRITAAGSTELSIAQVMPRNDDRGRQHNELFLP